MIISPQVGACLSALGIVAEKQAVAQQIKGSPGCPNITEPIGIMVLTCFFVTRPMREFVRLRRTGGEMIIHGAFQQ